MSFFTEYSVQPTSSALLFAVILLSQTIISELARRYARLSHILESRTNLVVKYISILFWIIAIVGLIVIWGVKTENIITTLSAVITVIGVAFFASWSILSNVTAGIILLFLFPFKIGDVIRLHDKDFPIEAEIIDIRAFHILLRTTDGELISYPNNILLQKGVSILGKFPTSDIEFTD